MTSVKQKKEHHLRLELPSASCVVRQSVSAFRVCTHVLLPYLRCCQPTSPWRKNLDHPRVYHIRIYHFPNRSTARQSAYSNFGGKQYAVYIHIYHVPNRSTARQSAYFNLGVKQYVVYICTYLPFSQQSIAGQSAYSNFGAKQFAVYMHTYLSLFFITLTKTSAL